MYRQNSRMAKVSTKTQWLFLLVCLLIPVLGKVYEDENVINIEDLLLNVQSALKAFKKDQDEIRKSIDDRLKVFDTLREEVRQDLAEILSSVVNTLDTFELKVDGRFGKCERENVSALRPSFMEPDNPRLSKPAPQIPKTGERTTVKPTLAPTTQQPTTQEPKALRNCAEVYDQQSRTSGVYTIQPLGSNPFQVYCDMTTDGGGWTVFQRRGNFPGVYVRDFYRNWQQYKDGFGDVNKEYWIGLSKIYLMTRPENGDQELRIDLGDMEGQKRYAEYKRFKVENEDTQFRLNIGSYSGNAGDSLSYHNFMKFSTYDRDNDGLFTLNCAFLHQGGWWYKGCVRSSLNGLNLRVANRIALGKGICWHAWRGLLYSLVQTEMKFRPMTWIHKKN